MIMGEGHSCTLGTIGMGSWMLQRLSPHPTFALFECWLHSSRLTLPILGNVPTLLSSCSSYSPGEKDWGSFSLPWYPRELAQMESGLLPEPITSGQQHRGWGRWQLPWLVELKRPPGDSYDSRVGNVVLNHGMKPHTIYLWDKIIYIHPIRLEVPKLKSMCRRGGTNLFMRVVLGEDTNISHTSPAPT